MNIPAWLRKKVLAKPELVATPVVDVMPVMDMLGAHASKQEAPKPACAFCGGRTRVDGYCKPCMKWAAE